MYSVDQLTKELSDNFFKDNIVSPNFKRQDTNVYVYSM